MILNLIDRTKTYKLKIPDVKDLSSTVLKRKIAVLLKKQYNIICPPSWQCLWIDQPTFRIIGHKMYILDNNQKTSEIPINKSPLYNLKKNSNLHILDILEEQNIGIDILSTTNIINNTINFLNITEYIELLKDSNESFNTLISQLPKDKNNLLNPPEDNETAESLSNIFYEILYTYIFPYWTLASGNDGPNNFASLLYNDNNYRNQLIMKINRWEKEYYEITPSEQIIKLSDEFVNRQIFKSNESSIVWLSLDVEGRDEPFIHLQQLFYYFHLTEQIPFKSIKDENDIPIFHLHKKIQNIESKKTITNWFKKISGFTLKVKIDNKRYATVHIYNTGRINIRCSWDYETAENNIDKIKHCISILRPIIQYINKDLKDPRKVFISKDGLPSQLRLRTKFKNHVTIRSLDATYNVGIDIKPNQLEAVFKSRNNKQLLDYFIIANKPIVETQTIKFNYIKDRNENEPIVVLINPISVTTQFIIRHCRSLDDLNDITIFLQALSELYLKKLPSRRVKIRSELLTASKEEILQAADKGQLTDNDLLTLFSDRGWSLYELVKQNRISKLKLLQYYDAELFTSKVGYATKCQQPRQPIIVTDEELQQLQQGKDYIYVMKYRGYNFICDIHSKLGATHPGLRKQFIKGKTLYLPCCFVADRDPRETDIYKRVIEQKEIPNVFTPTLAYTIEDERKILKPGQIGILPDSLNKLFNNPTVLSNYPKKYKFTRTGVIQGPDSFLHAILAAYSSGYRSSSDINQFVLDFKNNIIKHLSNGLFNSLNNGTLAWSFDYNKNRFIDMLLSNDFIKGYDIWWDLLFKLYKINIFVFELALLKDAEQKVNILCYIGETGFNPEFPTIFILKREQIYEPIFLTGKTILKTIFKDDIVTIVRDLSKWACKQDIFPYPLSYIHPFTANETVQQLVKGYYVNSQVEPYAQVVNRGKCELIVAKNGAMIPVIPSEPVYQVIYHEENRATYLPIRHAKKYIPSKTKRLLEEVKQANPTIPCNPIAQILNDTKKCTALLLENGLFVPTIARSPIDTLPIEKNARYYPMAPYAIKNEIIKKDKRIEFVDTIRRQQNFYINLLLHIGLFFKQESIKYKQRFLNIIQQSNLTIEERKMQLEPLLQDVFIRIFSRHSDIFQIQNENSPERKVLTKNFHRILHRLASDPEARIIEGKLGYLLQVLDIPELPNEIRIIGRKSKLLDADADNKQIIIQDLFPILTPYRPLEKDDNIIFRDAYISGMFVIQNVPNDGNCMFRALANSYVYAQKKQLWPFHGPKPQKQKDRKQTQLANILRQTAVDYICKTMGQTGIIEGITMNDIIAYSGGYKQGETFSQYCRRMKQPGTGNWGGYPELIGLWKSLNISIHVYDQHRGTDLPIVTYNTEENENIDNILHIYYVNSNHYMAMYPIPKLNIVMNSIYTSNWALLDEEITEKEFKTIISRLKKVKFATEFIESLDLSQKKTKHKKAIQIINIFKHI